MPDRAVLITLLILEHPLCPDCIAEKAQCEPLTVRAYLERIGASVTVQRLATERCGACGTVGTAVSISRNT